MEIAVTMSDRALVELARTDRTALGRFYDRHERELLGYMMRCTGDGEIAADLAAETFAALLQAIVKGQSIDEPRAWLYAVARRKVVDAFRRGRVDDAIRQELRMQPLELTDELIHALEGLDGLDVEAVRAALAELPGDQRHAITERVLDERSYADIARSLECSEAVVRKRVSRGLGHLRRVLEGRIS